MLKPAIINGAVYRSRSGPSGPPPNLQMVLGGPEEHGAYRHKLLIVVSLGIPSLSRGAGKIHREEMLLTAKGMVKLRGPMRGRDDMNACAGQIHFRFN